MSLRNRGRHPFLFLISGYAVRGGVKSTCVVEDFFDKRMLYGGYCLPLSMYENNIIISLCITN